jgi:hypothetical protein
MCVLTSGVWEAHGTAFLVGGSGSGNRNSISESYIYIFPIHCQVSSSYSHGL